MDTSSLDQLKTVHLPDPVSIFPLAIGWYILITILIVVIVGLIFWEHKKRKKRYQNSYVYNLLKKIEESSSDGADDTLSEVTILLKRVAMLKFPKENPHTLFGKKWLLFLDKTGKTNSFTNGDGKILEYAYQRYKIENKKAFFSVIREWLRVVL